MRETSGGRGRLQLLSAAGLVGGAIAGAVVTYGFMHGWGADQWGPVAAWFAGAATLAAVVVALRQANIALQESSRLQLARLVDHEMSRRRECIEAYGDLSAAIVSMAIEFRVFTDYLDDLPKEFDGLMSRMQPERPNEASIAEVTRHFVTFFDRWVQTIQPPLFIALSVLHGTQLYDAALGINRDVAKMTQEDTPATFVGIRKQLEPNKSGYCQRPDTAPLTAAWQDISGRRDEHLALVQKHFSLHRKDVERAVREGRY